MQRQAVKHARLTDREVGDVDGFLHFAQTLLEDLAHFPGHDLAKRILVLAELLANLAHELTPRRGRQLAPAQIGLMRRRRDLLVVVGIGLLHLGDQFAGGRAVDFQQRAIAAQPLAGVGARVDLGNAQFGQEGKVDRGGGRAHGTVHSNAVRRASPPGAPP